MRGTVAKSLRKTANFALNLDEFRGWNFRGIYKALKKQYKAKSSK